MTAMEQKTAAKEFVDDRSGKGYERGETSCFWIDPLDKVYVVANISKVGKI